MGWLLRATREDTDFDDGYEDFCQRLNHSEIRDEYFLLRDEKFRLANLLRDERSSREELENENLGLKASNEGLRCALEWEKEKK